MFCKKAGNLGPKASVTFTEPRLFTDLILWGFFSMKQIDLGDAENFKANNPSQPTCSDIICFTVPLSLMLLVYSRGFIDIIISSITV